MKIVLASSEVVPFAKTGGLADVTGALPGELARLGHEITVFMPAYRCVAEQFELERTEFEFEIPVGDHPVKGRLKKTLVPKTDVVVYLVDHPEFFDRPGIYGEGGTDYPDNCDRFTFFARSLLEAIRLLQLDVDLIHCNDWQTSLIPALLRCEFAENPVYAGIATLLTIHNLAYQGVFPAEKMSVTGLDPVHFNWESMEFYGKLNLLKAGIVFADSINTVSPTYAKEIQTEAQGCGLEGVLQHRAAVLSGILNGIDETDWNPTLDPHIAANFDATFDVSSGSAGKRKCKAALQKECQLAINPDIPLIGIVGRLAEQKGWSLILPVLGEYLANRAVQWVILGTGSPEYHSALTSLHRAHPDRLALSLGFSNEFAHRIEAGSDMFVMPSRYEPCGLNQMYSMAYGTVPIVRRTGGLADTVVDTTPDSIAAGTASGFTFDAFTAPALKLAIERAIRMYREDQGTWRALMLTGMNRDWSWKSSAKQYESLYRITSMRRKDSAETGH